VNRTSAASSRYHEPRVVLGFGERLVVESDGTAWVGTLRLGASELSQDGGARGAGRGRRQCGLEQRVCTAHVARLEVSLGGGKNAATRVVDVCVECEPEGLLQELGRGRRRSSFPGTASGVFEHRGDLGARFGRRQREVAGLLLGVRDNPGELRVERPTLRRGRPRPKG
jgi:hypothetical protein